MAYQDVKTPWEGWRVIDKIGEGGFGSVYEIERSQYGIQERAAMKVITIPQSADEIDDLLIEGYDNNSITQRFDAFAEDIVREYGMMAQMKGNANIVYCDDYRIIQQDNGFGRDIYIRMELLTPLLKAMDRVSSEQQIIRFGIEMCNALEACQKRKVIHRDIKPQNIFVSDDGVFKLGDFGIARKAEKTTRATVGKGTYQFMAPEVKNEQPYGPTVDMYSLGLVMYWLLNNRRCPFFPLPPAVPTHKEEQEALRRRFSGEKIPEPKNGSKELKRIVLKACAFDPKDRYQSAREMREDILRLSSGQTAKFIPEPKPTPILDVQDDTDDNKTVGPIFNHTQVGDADNLDKTVGPQFSVEEQLPELPDKKKKLGSLLVIAACFIAVAVMLLPKKDEVPQVAENILMKDTFISFEQAKEILGEDASGDQLIAYCAEQPAFGSDVSRGQIVSVNFLDTVADAPDDRWDVSYDQSGKVLAWVVPNGEYFDLYIAGEGGVSGKEATASMFYCYLNLREIHFNGNFYTKDSVDMSSMFYQCRNLTDVDLCSLDTSSATNMANMFGSCKSLQEPNVSSFDTSAVTDMRGMFGFCDNLKELDVSNFDTSHVTDMYCMFTDCYNLERLDVSGFDTSAVTSMRQMFCNCSNLTELDVSSFNTSSVTNMSCMFYRCSNLRNLNVSNFDTSHVTGMGCMFTDCYNLERLDVSGFDTSAVTSMGEMFWNCSNLTELDVSSFNTSSVINMESMFGACSNLRNLNVSNFNTSFVTNMRYMFFKCSSLKDLDVSGFDVSKVEWYDCFMDSGRTINDRPWEEFFLGLVTQKER